MNRLSSIPGCIFPAIPSPYAAVLSNIVSQLLHSERLPHDQLVRLQYAQLASLFGHAFERSSFWRGRLDALGWKPGEGVDASLLGRLPILTRANLQDHFDDLQAKPLDAAYGASTIAQTSGSTGKAVRVTKCGLQNRLYDAVTMRDHLWHKRDFTRKISAIRQSVETRQWPNWGRPVAALFRTGPASTFDARSNTLDEQLDWLIHEQPGYLTTTTARAHMLASLALERHRRVESLSEVISYGTTITPDARASVQQAFGARMVDRYSSEEVGYIASQCPHGERYHVHAETVIVEIVDDDGQPVGVGETGRVLVTVLHSFAMPIIRYQVGDLAVAGAPCDCGRTLPVVEKIAGREVTVLRLPDGRSKEVSILARRLLPFAPLREFRVVMYADDVVDFFFICDGPVGDSAREGLVGQVQRELGHAFPVRLKQVTAIDWGPSLKRENFIRVDRASLP